MTTRCSRTKNHIDLLARRTVLCIIGTVSLLIFLVRNRIPGNLLLDASILCASCHLFAIFKENFKLPFGKRIESLDKAVLITGCDTGFGFNLARRLAADGFQVFAGCLSPFEGGALTLGRVQNMHPLQMDVTRAEQVDAALEYVSRHRGSNELWAVVNNAGISKGSRLELSTMDDVQDVMDVNLLGPMRVTRTFLPLLRASRGRVVNVASAAGRFTMPGFLPYSVSKRALIAFSDALRLEMRSLGVDVVSVEPWMYRTRLSNPSSVSSVLEGQWNQSSSTLRETYDNAYMARTKRDTGALFRWATHSNLDEVTDALVDALTLACAPYCIRPGKFYFNVFLWILNILPRPVGDYVLCQFVFKC